MKKLLFVSLISFTVFGCKKQPIDTPKVEKKDSVLSFAINSGFTNQGVPLETNTKLFSWVLLNGSLTDSLQIMSATVELVGSPELLESLSISGGGVSVVPKKINTFALNVSIASAQTIILDVSGKTGSVEDSLSATLLLKGVNKKTGKEFATRAVRGQNIRIVNGSLAYIRMLTPASSLSQYVPCGDDGTTIGATTWTLEAKAENTTITFTELKFSTMPNSNVKAIKVGNISAPVVANTAWLTGLSIPIPVSGSPRIQILADYGPVGINGHPSGTMSSISLIEVKYRMGDSRTIVQQVTGLTSPQMRSVGSRPTFSLFSSNQPLVVGENHIATVEVRSDEKGDVEIINIPLLLSLVNAQFVANQNLVVRDENNAVVPTWGTPAFTGNVAIVFSPRQRIGAGQSKLFKIFAPVASVGAPGTSIVSTSLPPSNDLRWFDIKGDAVSSEQGVQFFPFWPANSVQIRN